ncbi:hypothetical protein GFER_09440 [Geoalkalibacter ferrihydriticus DSM 17813]|uniref:Murein endopeptidase K n=2 Tax=Geoalkalibacter ferrihydriticus TaxID=392333 RepID=A0A0C2EDR1_9BACT|nr:hypothetical protein GFER_09440 [Geoalkalibacter ferrihydriticus DSM 17813]
MQEASCRLNRRTFIKGHLAALAVLALPAPALALARPTARERALSFYNIHTGEKLKNAIYWADGGYVEETLDDISFLLRDFRRNEVGTIDPELLDQVFSLRRAVGAKNPVHIISGYRSPATNEMLAQQSGGVARRSFHMDGRAVDLRIPGCDLQTVRRAAIGMQRGGVGFYPRSDFVHIDTGPVRSW